MNLHVRILHFVDGIGSLDSRKSVATIPLPGVPAADSVRRIPGAYLIAWKGKLVLVPDARVLCAEVEDLDAKTEEKPADTAPAETKPASEPAVPQITENEANARAALAARQELARTRKRPSKVEPAVEEK